MLPDKSIGRCGVEGVYIYNQWRVRGCGQPGNVIIQSNRIYGVPVPSNSIDCVHGLLDLLHSHHRLLVFFLAELPSDLAIVQKKTLATDMSNNGASEVDQTSPCTPDLNHVRPLDLIHGQVFWTSKIAPWLVLPLPWSKRSYILLLQTKEGVRCNQ